MNAYRTKPLRYPWPPLLYLTGILMAIVAGRMAALQPMPSPHPLLLPSIGLTIALFAVSLDIWAVRTLMERQTPVLDTGCARHLVTCGPFRFSRNPIYLGYTLFTLALGLMSGNSWFFVAAFVSVTATRLVAIPSEERHLEARFGFDYESYRKRTRRWI
ncbi:isoprenylcysteine carboxylmethyltransferase family protein [Rhizobium sp. AQ_MP]|uniref:methyltransferase family protein n=1 Tax=Rhizobium sp. AQ_MP TaxID=2761536 RepID=UPI0016399B9B|nr:isoprenylcysteine carboxylmethyltransferase family protein [Rhizobium sp. AQ_MP]MBC2773358.1 isoprenylcysteine carboxylmethyltransferase family protein [Rhizobium sp. AQ_MP]